MARPDARPSPAGSPAGDAARALYDEVTDDLLYDPAFGRATMMGYPGVRLAGKYIASYDAENHALVVKLTRDRVAELVATGTGQAFQAHGKTLREWVALPTPDRRAWQGALAEAVAIERARWTT